MDTFAFIPLDKVLTVRITYGQCLVAIEIASTIFWVIYFNERAKRREERTKDIRNPKAKRK